jgi:hypothetical protein
MTCTQNMYTHKKNKKKKKKKTVVIKKKEKNIYQCDTHIHVPSESHNVFEQRSPFQRNKHLIDQLSGGPHSQACFHRLQIVISEFGLDLCKKKKKEKRKKHTQLHISNILEKRRKNKKNKKRTQRERERVRDLKRERGGDKIKEVETITNIRNTHKHLIKTESLHQRHEEKRVSC